MASEVRCLSQAGNAMGRAAASVFSPKFSSIRGKKGSSTMKPGSITHQSSQESSSVANRHGENGTTCSVSRSYHCSPTSSQGKVPLPSSMMSTLSSVGGNAGIEDDRRKLLNSLLYRSKQRGYLELDLLLGKWTEENISNLKENEIRSLVSILNEENPDLWKWLTGQSEPPEAVKSNVVFVSLRNQIASNLESHSNPKTRAAAGSPWVRGWDDNDKKKQMGSPPAGNQ